MARTDEGGSYGPFQGDEYGTYSSSPSSSKKPDKKRTSSKAQDAVRSAGQQLNQWGVEQDERLADPRSMKRGGKVKRGGVARLHKGEKVFGKNRGRKRAKRGRY